MLPERKQMILKAIIEQYIDLAEPVGSKTLMGSFEKPLSSATIRNEMSELEEMGFLEKQHISSGRVPSAMAYRLYVNELMDRYRIAAMELAQMRQEMQRRMNEIDSIMLAASRAVSRLTNHTAIAVAEKDFGEHIRKVELIPMDGSGQSYALVLLSDNSVRNKIIRLSQPISAENAHALTGLVNASIGENRLDRLRGLVAQSFGIDTAFFQLTETVVGFIEEAQAGKGSKEVYVEGASRLLQNREYQDVEKARELLEHLSNGLIAQNLVEGVLPGQINIRIGPENREPSMHDASFIFTSYKLEGNMRGIIGIVAPTRMDYAKASAQLAAFVDNLGSLSLGNTITNIGDNDERET